MWTRQGTKKVTQDDRVVIEVEEPARGKTLSTRRIAIPLRQYAILELECDELQGRFEIKPEPFLQQRELNLWMDNFVIYNIPEDKEVNVNEETKIQKAPIRNEDSITINNESGKEQKKVRIPYCIINFSYVNHSYIPRGRVIAFAEKEKEEENKIFKVEEIKGQEEYRNWVPKNRGSLPVPLKSDFLCSPAEVSKHRKVKLKSIPIEEDTAKMFDELCDHFPEIFSNSSKNIGKTNLITMDIDTGDHPPICQKPYTLPLKHYEWVQKEFEQLERAGIITRSVSPWASPFVIVPKKSAPDEPPRRRMCINFQRLNVLQLTMVKLNSKVKGNLTLHPLPKIDELYTELNGAKIFSALGLTSGYYHIKLGKDLHAKTAFVTPFGKWEFNMVSFSLAQAPTYFQALISMVLEGLSHFSIAYLDDIIIFSKNKEEHLQHLEIIFERLCEAGLKLKRSKCSFMKMHIEYLGHLILEKGTEPMLDKLSVIKRCQHPETPKKSKSS